MDFLFNVLIWVGVVIFVIFIVGFMAAAKLNKRQDANNQNQRRQSEANQNPSNQNKE
ncbi:hypothetical protein [Alteromonas gracilis]|uniref:hypothetical protein n=1 Tax=Alteromonas gracilis TaxID=1479524 RepID=UPI0037369C44